MAAFWLIVGILVGGLVAAIGVPIIGYLFVTRLILR